MALLVSFDPATPPQRRSWLTAALTDPDGGVSGVTWQWAISTDGTTWSAITGATRPAYAPVPAHVGKYLRATASYTEECGFHPVAVR